jgi:glyoxylase-like metal-dependent hydrolase (beta-lactamase superfamily II)
VDEPVVLDTNMLGHAGVTAAFVVRGRATALVETGPKSKQEHVLDGLRALGVQRLDHIVVTHIHLDHAGAAGTLAARFPEAVVSVHPAGARHLVDPTRLWSSAARIYGDAMEEMWGGIDPVPAERIQVINDSDSIDLGGRALRAIETPGHASHHHAFLDDQSGICFAGDALGVRLQDLGLVRPATPPPEFDLEAAIASIERIAALGANSIWLTHYGPADGGTRPLAPEEVCEEAIEALRDWAAWVSEARAEASELDDVTARVRARARAAVESSLEHAELERLEATTTYRMNTWGYLRYLDKLEADRSSS